MGRARAVVATLLAASCLLPGPAAAQRAGGTVRAARADLADLAQGSYFGEIVSVAGGSARAGIRVRVTKIGPNRVRVTSDPERLLPFTAQLVRALDTIRDSGGPETFLLDLTGKPRALTLRVGGISWSGRRE